MQVTEPWYARKPLLSCLLSEGESVGKMLLQAISIWYSIFLNSYRKEIHQTVKTELWFQYWNYWNFTLEERALITERESLIVFIFMKKLEMDYLLCSPFFKGIKNSSLWTEQLWRSFYCCLTSFCYLMTCILQHFYFFLTSEKIWDVDNDIFSGFVISKLDFNGEEYFEKILFLNQFFSVFRTWINQNSVDLKFWIINST